MVILSGRVTNEDILLEIAKSKFDGKVTNKLGRVFVWIAERRANVAQYDYLSYRADMIAHAITKMVEGYVRFNPEKSDNPFAYLHTIAGCAFANYICKEQREKRIAEERYEE